MRIDGPQRPAPAASAPKARRDDGQTFTLGTAAKPAETRAAAPASSLGGVGALLAVQMVGDSLEGRRRGVRRGRNLLDALDGLKIALLGGRVSAGELQRLVMLVEGRERDSDDPRLESLLDEIETRARVEVAKLEGLRQSA